MLKNNMKRDLSRCDSWSRRRLRAQFATVMFVVTLAYSSPSMSDAAGRLEADADFLLGHWSSKCADGKVDIFLRDGALRQQGLLRLIPKGGGEPVTPVTLLAATRDGPGLVLEAASQEGGFRSSARYTAHIGSDNSLVLKSMTLCHGQQCRSASLDVPWKRCAE